jgi:hypothetical protein
MIDDSECILIWAFPSWDAWTRFELAFNGVSEPAVEPLDAGVVEGLRDWQQKLYTRSKSFRRFLMLDAPLCPLKIGRQPARSDRVDNWDEG